MYEPEQVNVRSDGREYGIRELSELAGVSARTLRYYDAVSYTHLKQDGLEYNKPIIKKITIFRAGCDSLPAVKPASRKAGSGEIPGPTV